LSVLSGENADQTGTNRSCMPKSLPSSGPNSWSRSCHYDCGPRMAWRHGRTRNGTTVALGNSKHDTGPRARSIKNPRASRLHRRRTNRASEDRCVPPQYQRAPAEHKHCLVDDMVPDSNIRMLKDWTQLSIRGTIRTPSGWRYSLCPSASREGRRSGRPLGGAAVSRIEIRFKSGAKIRARHEVAMRSGESVLNQRPRALRLRQCVYRIGEAWLPRGPMVGRADSQGPGADRSHEV